MSSVASSSTSGRGLFCWPPLITPSSSVSLSSSSLEPGGFSSSAGAGEIGSTSSSGSGDVSTSMKKYVPCSTPWRLVRLSSLPSAVIASPVFSNRRLRYLMSLSICFAASPVHCVIKIYDPTIRRGQLVGLPLFYVVAVEKPSVQSPPHIDLEELPVAGIHRLHLVGAFRGQKPKHLSTVRRPREAAVHSSTVLRFWREIVPTRSDLPWYRNAGQCG